MKTAILVDGGFYRHRAQSRIGDKTPADRADELTAYCMRHLRQRTYGREDTYSELYRIFYYDCPPSGKKVYHPLLKQQMDLSKTELYRWTMEFLDELKSHRKVALRLGKLAEGQAQYTLKPDVIKRLCNGTLSVEDLKERDFMLSIEQEGVDMKIGLDIASLAFKKQVDQIVLISGDSDFVPAAKLARREGIDFILDPLGATVKSDLLEHIDGLKSCDNAYKLKFPL